MTNSWNSVIFMKSDKPWSELMTVRKWEGVENMWSTSGDWDWCIKLDSKCSTPEQTEDFIQRMRDGRWATNTMTHWWKDMSHATR